MQSRPSFRPIPTPTTPGMLIRRASCFRLTALTVAIVGSSMRPSHLAVTNRRIRVQVRSYADGKCSYVQRPVMIAAWTDGDLEANARPAVPQYKKTLLAVKVAAAG